MIIPGEYSEHSNIFIDIWVGIVHMQYKHSRRIAATKHYVVLNEDHIQWT